MFINKKYVVVNVEEKPTEKYEIPLLLLLHWKSIITWGATIIVMLLTALIIFSITEQPHNNSTLEQDLIFDRIEAERRLLGQTQENPDGDVNPSTGNSKIDSTLNKINEKMRRRGLSPIYIPNSGGPIEKNDANLLNDYHEILFTEIDRQLSELPLGVPHIGTITSLYGYRRNPFSNSGKEIHLGIDFRGKVGDKIRATARGTVLSTGHQAGYGFVVKITHANGYETRYAHLSGILVKPGQQIEAGKEIGLLGSTGRSTGPHVHYEILKDNKKINPIKFIAF